jgi:hypothetical protein
MLKPSIYLISVSFVLALLAGCGDATSRQLATDTLASTVSYEQSMDRKVSAERAFYDHENKLLVQPLFGINATNGSIEASHSLYYLTIKNSADRDGLTTSEDMATTSSPKLMSLLISYTDAGVTQEQQLYAQLLAEQTATALSVATQLKALNEQADQLQVVRQQLLVLTQKETTTERASQLVTMGKAVQAAISKGQAKK